MEEQRARKKQRKLLAATEDDIAEYDLLSSLPEPLIHHVLSFLPLKEIVKASATCKSWRRIFSSFPVLDLQYQEFIRNGSVRDGVERMVRFADATLTRFQEQHLKIDKLGIQEAKDDCLSRIDRWTAIALDSGAQEISIALRHHLYWWGDLPPEPPSLELVALPGSTDLKSLRSLTLDGCRAGEFLSWGRLMSACGSLESLSLSGCCLKEVRISGLRNLKTVSITGCKPTRLVEIEARRLESFKLYKYKAFIRKRTHRCVVNVNHSPNLKSLALRSLAKEDDWFRDFISRFQLLQDLTLGHCESLSMIRISNPLIENIKLTWCNNLTDISIEAPQLRRFHLRKENGLLPSIRMKNPPRRKPVAMVTVCFPEQVVQWPCKIRESLVGSCKSFSPLHFRAYTHDYVLELQNDIKYGWLCVIACNPQQLSLARCRATQEAMHRAFDGTGVNGHILTPHPATVTAVAGLSDDDFLQLFFDKVTKCGRCSRESRQHCTSYADIKIVTGSNN